MRSVSDHTSVFNEWHPHGSGHTLPPLAHGSEVSDLSVCCFLVVEGRNNFVKIGEQLLLNGEVLMLWRRPGGDGCSQL